MGFSGALFLWVFLKGVKIIDWCHWQPPALPEATELLFTTELLLIVVGRI